MILINYLGEKTNKMINKILKESTNKIQVAKQEVAKRIEEDQAKRELVRGFPKPLSIVPDKPYYISFLHDFNYGLELLLHDVWEYNETFNKKVKKRIICNKLYKDIDPIYNQCDICESFRDDGIKQKAYPVRVFIGFVHTLNGEKFQPPGSDKIYELDPVRLVEVRFGRNKSIIQQLEKDHTRGKFLKSVFELSKVGTGKDTVYMPLTAYDNNEDWLVTELKLGEQAKISIPGATDQLYKSYSEDEICQRILQSYENVKWDLWGVNPPIPEEETPEPEMEKVAASKKASKALNS